MAGGSLRGAFGLGVLKLLNMSSKALHSFLGCSGDAGLRTRGKQMADCHKRLFIGLRFRVNVCT